MATGTDDPGPDGLIARGRRLVKTAFSDLSETDPRVEQLKDAETRSVERHSLGNRISHWLQVILFTLLLWTGLAIWTGNYAVLDALGSSIWGGYYIAFGIHMWAGILGLAVTFVIFPYYYIVADDHRQLLEMADIQVGAAVIPAFLGLRKYLPYYHDARRAYDEDEEDWMAHHPAQKSFFWWFAIFFGVLALTGFAMFREMTAEPSWWIDALGFLSAFFAFELLKQIHLVLAFVTTAMVVFHIYFAVLPGNWDILKSMFVGDVKAYIVHGERESAEEPTAGDGDGPPSGDDGPTPAADGGEHRPAGGEASDD